MKTFIKENFIHIIMFIVIILLSGYIYYIDNKTTESICTIEQHKDGVYSNIFNDQEIISLKKTNKELYDSIKHFKNEINYLAQFKYKKQYKSDTVYVPKKDTIKIKENVYEYSNNQNDSLNYNLKIGSTKEPNWYALDITISDKLTLINKNMNNMNETTIKSDNNAEITDVTLFNKKKKKTLLQHFNAGPGIMVGYDITNKNVGVMVGFSVTYTIW